MHSIVPDGTIVLSVAGNEPGRKHAFISGHSSPVGQPFEAVDELSLEEIALRVPDIALLSAIAVAPARASHATGFSAQKPAIAGTI